MNTNEAIRFLEKQIKDPKIGLPEEIFLFASRITPLVNVDLLIKDPKGRTLLSMRDDPIHGLGWHIPGGIIRIKESFDTRIKKVMENEIGTRFRYDLKPIAVNQFINNNITRGHFISFLYRCHLSSKFIPLNKGLNSTDRGYLKWHDSCPDNLIKCQEAYKRYL